MEGNAHASCAAALLLVCACGGSKLHASGTGHGADLVFVGTAPEPSESSPPSLPVATVESVDRAAVDRVLDQGLGRLFQWLEIEPVHRGGAFVGFRLVALKHASLLKVGLRAGDIITRLNGLPVGLPEEALEAWEQLRDASEIVVDYERDGEPRTLRIPIAD